MRRSRQASRSRQLRVLVLVDPECVDAADPEFLDVTPDTETEHYVLAGLRNLKHHVTVLPFLPGRNHKRYLADDIVRAKPDIVFNLVQHMFQDRRLAANAPGLLEILGIPYTGASSVGMSSIDKAASKQLVSAISFAVPAFVILPCETARPAPDFSHFPAIVKAQFGGASEGLTAKSIVHSTKEMVRRARVIHRKLKQAAICEQYIEGRELSVALLGNSRDVKALPIRETFFDRAGDGGPTFCTELVKDSPPYRERWGVRYGRAELPPKLEAGIQRLCEDAFRLPAPSSGYARFDLRLDAASRPVFLEANSNPDLAPRYFGMIASWAGLSYEAMIERILQAGLERETPSV